jgi:anti-anti-sigma regulatory factor
VPVPVYEPPVQVDSTNIAGFASRIAELIARYDALVVDCSQVDLIGPSGMRVLRQAARDASVTLVNPNASLRLMAAAYGFAVDHTATTSEVSSRESRPRAAADRMPTVRKTQ